MVHYFLMISDSMGKHGEHGNSLFSLLQIAWKAWEARYCISYDFKQYEKAWGA